MAVRKEGKKDDDMGGWQEQKIWKNQGYFGRKNRKYTGK